MMRRPRVIVGTKGYNVKSSRETECLLISGFADALRSHDCFCTSMVPRIGTHAALP